MTLTPKDLLFNLLSYAVVFCGFISLWMSAGVNLFIAALFVVVLISSWFLEGNRWQLSNRVGTSFVLIIILLFYVCWKFPFVNFVSNEIALASTLEQMILILASIKLFQKKNDKDWVFLYLISFFEILLAAGLSISPLYLASFVLYLLVVICAVIAFEIKKTSSVIEKNLELKQNLSVNSKKLDLSNKNSLLWLSRVAALLMILMIGVAAPIFFLLPRVGGAGLGNHSSGLSGFTGFSDSVNLGEIGQLKQNDEIVMRVRIDKLPERKAGNYHWRGVALDFFNNKSWIKSKDVSVESKTKTEKNVFLIDYQNPQNDLTVQTVYLEPIDSNALFALAHPVALQGNFQTLVKDSEQSLTVPRNNFERTTYNVYSDETLPSQTELQSDNKKYLPKDYRYLKIPENTDGRIEKLASQLTEKANNRFDKARIIESYLQNNFGYSLDMKSTGEQPLAEFLFNIRQGHCEYFATAMAVMLRTQGIATRLVNGFQEGEYNETADVFVVRQKNAHSWVEVYFPEQNVWVPFDPTPFAGQNDGTPTYRTLGKFNTYLEALETFWIQYFVAYDSQEQRSLMRSVRSGFSEYQTKTSGWLGDFKTKFAEWWKEARGDEGFQASTKAIGFGVLYFVSIVLSIVFLIWAYRKIIKFTIWRHFSAWIKNKNEGSIVEFYEQMQKVLAVKGFTRAVHQTPLEFAFALDMPEAVKITEKYNRVRFGEKNLSNDEAREIASWLESLKKD